MRDAGTGYCRVRDNGAGIKKRQGGSITDQCGRELAVSLRRRRQTLRSVSVAEEGGRDGQNGRGGDDFADLSGWWSGDGCEGDDGGRDGW